MRGHRENNQMRYPLSSRRTGDRRNRSKWPTDANQLSQVVAFLSWQLPAIMTVSRVDSLVEQKLVMEGRPAASTLVRDSHHLAALRVKLQRNEAVRDGLVAVARTSCHALHLATRRGRELC